MKGISSLSFSGNTESVFPLRFVITIVQSSIIFQVKKEPVDPLDPKVC